MSPADDEPDTRPGVARLAAALRTERESREWNIAELAARSGVSRAMISRVERGEASPTAALLGKLSGAFELTMSQLVARGEAPPGRISRRDQQPRWTDPETGYVRRAVSPAGGGPLELVEVDLPAGAEVAYPAAAYAFLRQHVWVLEGTLTLVFGDEPVTLDAGDCLALGAPTPLRFRNDGEQAVRYLVVLLHQ